MYGPQVFGAHADLLLQSEEMLEVSHNILVHIVKYEHLDVSSELVVVRACVRWAREHHEGLGDDVISNIRFLSMTPSEFSSVPNSWLTANERTSILAALAASGQFHVAPGLCDIRSARKPLVVCDRNNYTLVNYFALALIIASFAMLVKMVPNVKYGGDLKVLIVAIAAWCVFIKYIWPVL